MEYSRVSGSGSFVRGQQRRHRRAVAELSQNEHEIAANPDVLGPRGRERGKEPQALGRDGVPFRARLHGADPAGELEGRLPPAAGAAPPHLREVVPRRPALEGHEAEEEEDSDGGADDEEGQEKEADDEPSRSGGPTDLFFVAAGKLFPRALVAHRMGRYRLACVMGLGTKIASLSQTVSHRRHDTQGPASTSAILWNVSWSGSSIR